jgi:hypothetical protein
VAAVIDTTQEPVPVQAPLQPVKVEPVAGTALKLTDVPLAKFALQVVPQLIPTGVLVTVPVPVPFLVTFNAKLVILKVAVTNLAAFIVTWHDPEPVHAPLQPVNVDPAAGVAVRVTKVPMLKLALQVVPQLIPPDELVTVPLPDVVTVKVGLMAASAASA